MGLDSHVAATPPLPPAHLSSNSLGRSECGAAGKFHSNSPSQPYRQHSGNSVGLLDAGAPGSVSHLGSHTAPPIVNWSMHSPAANSVHHGTSHHLADIAASRQQMQATDNASRQSLQSPGYHGNPFESAGGHGASMTPGVTSWHSSPTSAAKPAVGACERQVSASVPPMHPGSPGSWVGGAWGIRPEEQSVHHHAAEEEELPRPRSSAVTPAKDLPLAGHSDSMDERAEPHLQVNESLRLGMELARLERRQIEHQTLQLDRQLGHLERIVSCIVSRPERAEEGEQVWQWGVKNWEERFVTEAIDGYYIDKSRVHAREEQLSKHRIERGEHSTVDWLAGKSDRRIAAEKQVLEEQAWRHLYQFGEVERDAYAD